MFFALEIILRQFSAEAFGIVVLSSVTASIVGRAFLGNTPFLVLPAFNVHSPLEYLAYAGLGLIAGLLGWAFARVLYLVEDVCDWLWRGPEWLRPAVGGLLLGGLLLALPQMYGVGYPVMQNSIEGRYTLAFLLVLLVAKMLATSLTIGIGGSGGVFAPSLFIGAMAGTAFGIVLQAWFPALDVSPGAYGLIGMAAVFAGASHAPIAALVIVFELTGQYTIILPLMAAVALATGVSHLVSTRTIYTLKLLRRGIDVDADAEPDLLRTLHVGVTMQQAPPSVAVTADLNDVTAELDRSDSGAAPVLDAHGYIGVVTAADIDAIDDPSATAGDLCLPVPSLHPTDTLHDAMPLLHEYSAGVTVVSADNAEVVGWLDHHDVLAAYARARRARAPAPVTGST